MKINLSDITVDPEIQLQTRGIDNDTVGGYVEAIAAGAEFPPVIIFQENGDLWLSDGFHRTSACRFLGLAEIEADVRPGTRQDAMVYAATANVIGTKPMSRAQKQEAGERLLGLTDWSQERIARELAVDPKTVSNWKISLEISRDKVSSTRNGKTYTMDTTNIGKSDDQPEESPEENLPLFLPDEPEEKEEAPQTRKKPKTNHKGDTDTSHPMDRCQTPAYAFVQELASRINPDWVIWEPAAGEGYLVKAMTDSNLEVTSSDILTGQNFFEYEPDEWDCIITNPPFSVKYDWLARCYELGKPFALLLPTETLSTQTAISLFRQYDLEVIVLDKRIDFKMPNKGWEGSSAQFPVMWFTWGLGIGEKLIFAEVNKDAQEHS